MSILVLATRNKGKIEEMRRLLDEFAPDVQLRSAAEFEVDDVDETGDSFEANALLKAETIARATGYPALADDSGICVDLLGGAPGIFSARWSGVHGDDSANIAKLLLDISGSQENERGAQFVCVIAIAKPDGSKIIVRGELAGQVLSKPRGSRGFGYDPVFQPQGESRSFAEMSAEEKDLISHRGRALREIAAKIGPFLASS